MSSNQECGGSIVQIAQSIDQTTTSIIDGGTSPGSPVETQLAGRDRSVPGFACFTSFTRATTAGSASL
jgi:hypothetical protein